MDGLQADDRHDGKVLIVSTTGGLAASSATKVDEPTTTGRPCGWSLDSSVLYLLLDTDGTRCRWGQRVDPADGHLIGTPYTSGTFISSGRLDSTSFGNAITADGFLYEGARARANLWQLQSTAAR